MWFNLWSHLADTINIIKDKKEKNPLTEVKIIAGHLPVWIDMRTSQMRVDPYWFWRFSLDTWIMGCKLLAELKTQDISSKLVIILDDQKKIWFSAKFWKASRKNFKKMMYDNAWIKLMPESYMNSMDTYWLEINDILTSKDWIKESVFFSEMTLSSIWEKLNIHWSFEPRCTKAYSAFLRTNLNPENDYLIWFIPEICTWYICTNLLLELDWLIKWDIDASHFFLSSARKSMNRETWETLSSNKFHQNIRSK